MAVSVTCFAAPAIVAAVAVAVPVCWLCRLDASTTTILAVQLPAALLANKSEPEAHDSTTQQQHDERVEQMQHVDDVSFIIHKQGLYPCTV